MDKYFIISVMLVAMFISTYIEGVGILGYCISILAGLWFLNQVPFIFDYVCHNLLSTLGIVILYAIIGIIWSFFKWYKLVTSDVGLIQKIKIGAEMHEISPIEYYRNVMLPIVPANYNTEATRLLRKMIPSVWDNLPSIISWWICWPTSVLIYLFADALYDLTYSMVKKLEKAYKAITNYAIMKVLK